MHSTFVTPRRIRSAQWRVGLIRKTWKSIFKACSPPQARKSASQQSIPDLGQSSGTAIGRGVRVITRYSDMSIGTSVTRQDCLFTKVSPKCKAASFGILVALLPDTRPGCLACLRRTCRYAGRNTLRRQVGLPARAATTFKSNNAANGVAYLRLLSGLAAVAASVLRRSGESTARSGHSPPAEIP